MTANRKNIFLSSYETEFVAIKRSKKGDEWAFCVPCKADICLTATGKTAISLHQKTEKHKSNARAANRTSAISGFFPNKSTPTNLDRQVAAAEGF